MALTVLTWNLKGSTPTDLGAAAAVVGEARADVVLFQEIQRHQARRLADRLGAASWEWGFKHWPLRTWPEGMAVLGVTVPAGVTTHAVTRPWRFWSWRRRIVQVAVLTDPPGMIVNVHLSPRPPAARVGEAGVVVQTVRSRGLPAVVAGDLNDRPGTPVLDQLLAAGLHDAWLLVHPDDDEARAATNWRRWSVTRTGPPNQRIDYVLVGDDVTVESVWAPRFGDPGFGRLAELSDHLPVAATIAWPDHP